METLRRPRATDFRALGLDLRHVADMDGWVVIANPAVPPWLGSETVWSDQNLSIHHNPLVPTRFGVSFDSIADFAIDFAGCSITVSTAHGSPETINHLLRDQIVPRILAHEGKLVLHAAGISGQGGAILLVGLSGVGKSTLAASLHHAGFPLLGDDAMIIAGEGEKALCRAVYRSLRLFPDSIARLLDSTAQHLPVASYTAKRNIIGLAGQDNLSAPIRAIFVIGQGDVKEVEVTSLAPSQACLSFIEHSFWLNPTNLAQTKQRMRDASALAGRIPAFGLSFPRDYSRLFQVHQAITSAAFAEGRDFE